MLKDLKIRYTRPFLGFFWAFLLPFLTVVILYLVFSLFFKVKTEEAPYILYLMSGIFTWRFFQDSLMISTTSLMDNKNLIRESNFPNFLIPVSVILSNAVIFSLPLIMLIFLSALLLKGLSVHILLLPLVLITHLILIMGLSVIASIYYVKWRDMKYLLEVLLLTFFYLTPIFYSLSLVRDSFSPFLLKIYIYNPFVCILNLYRITLFKGFYSFVVKDISFFALFSISAVFAITVLLLSFCCYLQSRKSLNDYLSY